MTREIIRRPHTIYRSHHGLCHHDGCKAPVAGDGVSGVFCRTHLAAREIHARENPAEVLTMADYSRDPVTGFLHKKIS